MFYYYTDTTFRGKIIRLIRADIGEQSLNDGLIRILRLTHEGNEDIVAVIEDFRNIFHSFRNKEDRELWQAYSTEHPLFYDEHYHWIREWAEV